MNLKPATAIIEMLHKIAALPRVYDRIQRMAGQEQCIERISMQTVSIGAKTVIDVGGGTGNLRRVWPADCVYVCMDIEMPKLQGFRSKVPAGLAVLSDAARMSIATGCADVVMLAAVMHHLTDSMLDQVFEETLRVLKSGGCLVFFDPVLNRDLWAGRMLWRLDRGSYPREVEELRKLLGAKFDVIHWEKYAVYHEYVFGIAVRP